MENKSTVINIHKDGAIRMNCFLSANVPNKDQYGIRKKRVTKIKKFKFDTGAQYTCLNAREFSINITEEEFREYVLFRCDGIWRISSYDLTRFRKTKD